MVLITKKNLQNQLWKNKWKACQVSYFPFLFMVFFWGLTHGFWMLGENRRRLRKRESDDTSNGRSSSSNLVPRLQTNPITISPVWHSHNYLALFQRNVSLKTAFCHKDCKGLDNIYTAGCAESRGVKLPKVKQHNCLPFLPQVGQSWAL